MVDYRINLAKDLASTPERRRRFYHGMLLYLALGAAGLVFTVQLAVRNGIAAYNAMHQRKALVRTLSAGSSVGKEFFRDPGGAYDDLRLYSVDLQTLRDALSEHVQFLPVISQLFARFPADIALESLEASADRKAIVLGLVGPGDSIKQQQAEWKKNGDILNRVQSIRQVKGETRTVGKEQMQFVEFECVLKDG